MPLTNLSVADVYPIMRKVAESQFYLTRVLEMSQMSEWQIVTLTRDISAFLRKGYQRLLCVEMTLDILQEGHKSDYLPLLKIACSFGIEENVNLVHLGFSEGSLLLWIDPDRLSLARFKCAQAGPVSQDKYRNLKNSLAKFGVEI